MAKDLKVSELKKLLVGRKIIDVEGDDSDPEQNLTLILNKGTCIRLECIGDDMSYIRIVREGNE